MGEKNKRKHNPKREPQQKDGSHNKGHKMHTSIVVFALPIFGGLLLAVAGMIYTAQKTPAIWLVFSATVLFALACCLYWQQLVADESENPPFSVGIGVTMAGTVRDTSLFAICNRTANSRFLSPVPLLLFMDVVNRQQIPVDISELKIEIRLDNRMWIFPRWMRTAFIPDYFPLLFTYAPPAPARRVELLGGSGRLVQSLSAAPMQPNKTARGWVVLDAPAEFDLAPRPLLFRITIRDTEGHTFTVIIHSPEDTELIGPTAMIKHTDAIDITGLPIIHWIDSH